MERIKIVSRVIAEDMEKDDPLASAIERAIFLRTNDRVKVKINRQVCIGMFECSSEISKLNNPLILNSPQAKPIVLKTKFEISIGDSITFSIRY